METKQILDLEYKSIGDTMVEKAIYDYKTKYVMKTVKKLIKKGWSDSEIRDFDDFYDLDQIAKIRYDVEHNAD